MRTKLFSDNDYHRYISPYETPYEAFINYMNVLSDVILRVEDMEKKRILVGEKGPDKEETPVKQKKTARAPRAKSAESSAKTSKKDDPKEKKVKSKH